MPALGCGVLREYGWADEAGVVEGAYRCFLIRLSVFLGSTLYLNPLCSAPLLPSPSRCAGQLLYLTDRSHTTTRCSSRPSSSLSRLPLCPPGSVVPGPYPTTPARPQTTRPSDRPAPSPKREKEKQFRPVRTDTIRTTHYAIHQFPIQSLTHTHSHTHTHTLTPFARIRPFALVVHCISRPVPQYPVSGIQYPVSDLQALLVSNLPLCLSVCLFVCRCCPSLLYKMCVRFRCWFVLSRVVFGVCVRGASGV